MLPSLDRRLLAFCGSATRVATLAVLANSERPLSGYRVSKLAGMQPIKIYRELERATRSGLVRKDVEGFRLSDPDLRLLLRKRVRLSWSEGWFDQEGARAERAERVKRSSTKWFDLRRYRRNAFVAMRYAREIERPPEKDDWPYSRTTARSRKAR